MNYILNMLTDSIFPRTCPVCGEIVSPQGQLICKSCLEVLDFVRMPVCEKCGKQILTESQHFCYDCAHKPKTFLKNRAILNYDDNARNCMVKIKYKNGREYIDLFGKMLAYQLQSYIEEISPDFLVPVPVHISRLRARGYNQAELLAKALSKETGIPVKSDLILRKKHTEAMKKLNSEERLNNLKEAFALNERAKSEKINKVMLVDDIYTTGATIETCSKILYDAGIQTASICVCIGSDI